MTSKTGQLQVQSLDGSGASVFKVLFWIHQVVLGVPSVGIALDLVFKGESRGIINGIGLLLAWIGGTLVWGLAALMHRTTVYNLPSVFGELADNIARLVPVSGGQLPPGLMENRPESIVDPDPRFSSLIDGVRYKINDDDTVTAKTPVGIRTYGDWETFLRALNKKSW